MGFKAFPYFISQCSWILYFVAYFLILTLFPSYTNKVVIRSLSNVNYKNWNSSIDPFIFAHISDTHVSSVIPDYNECFQKALETALKYKPNFTLNTGDLADNFDSNGFPRYGVQVEENWKIYSEIIKKTKYLDHNRIYSVAGNHDMFGVLNYSSEQNYFTKYLREIENVDINDINSFGIQVHTLNNDNGLINHLISLNPFLFPTAHPSMLIRTTMKKQYLNEIERLIEKYPKPIIMSHYPIASIHSEKSYKGRTFQDIIGSNDVLIYLAGHSHPSDVSIHHYGKGNIEMVGPSTRTNHEKFGIVTIDNGRLVWTLINQNEPTEFILTHPVPKEQLSIHSNFAEKNTEIRIIDFNHNSKRYKDTSSSNSIAKLHYMLFFVDTETLVKEGDIKTHRKMKDNNFTLYSEPLNITENGEYKLIITGDYYQEINFIVDSITEVGDEVELDDKLFMDHIVYLFLVIFIIFFIIVVPFKKNFSILEEVEDWIEGNYGNDIEIASNSDSSNGSSNSSIDIGNADSYFIKFSNWFFTLIFGFLLVRTRFQKNPLIIKLAALFFICSSLFIPSLLFETEGKVGMIWIFGVLIQNSSYFVDFGVVYEIIYLLVVCFPMIVLISSFGVEKRSRWQLGDMIFGIIFVVGVPFICIRSVIQATGRLFVMLSPQFVIFPILILIMFILWQVIKYRKQRTSVRNSLEQPLTSSI